VRGTRISETVAYEAPFATGAHRSDTRLGVAVASGTGGAGSTLYVGSATFFPPITLATTFGMGALTNDRFPSGTATAPGAQACVIDA
jgi:hypothetical protein